VLRDCALSLTLYGGVREPPGTPPYLVNIFNIFGEGVPGAPKHPLGFPTLFLGGVAIFNGFCVLVNHSPRTWQLRQRAPQPPSTTLRDSAQRTLWVRGVNAPMRST
jgi:hypothetical protein